MAFSIGAHFGGRFWGPKSASFCKKVRNFKKFRFWGPGSPTSILDNFDPPMAYQFFSTFGSIFNEFIRGSFCIDFGQFFTPTFSTFITRHFWIILNDIFNQILIYIFKLLFGHWIKYLLS
jgi:hypothetical protein